jgi:hypothetical protein
MTSRALAELALKVWGVRVVVGSLAGIPSQ